MFSFNGTARRVTDWEGLSLRWYELVLGDKEIQGHLMNSLIVGIATAIIATSSGRWRRSACSGRRTGSASRSTR